MQFNLKLWMHLFPITFQVFNLLRIKKKTNPKTKQTNKKKQQNEQTKTFLNSTWNIYE